VNAKHGRPLPIAYQPSLLRRFPVISFGEDFERLRAPLPQLVVLRASSGIYYDLIGGGTQLRNESGKRFELYCIEFITAMMPRFDVSRSLKYTLAGNVVDTPDVLIKDGGTVVAAIECKTAKLTFDAQFSEDPIADAKAAYDQIADGICQLWRYFSHARRGLLTIGAVEPNAHGIILTFDAWLMISHELEEQLVANAVALALKDPEITVEDRRKVLFCSVQDLECVLAHSDEDALLRTLSAAREKRFEGWQLPGIHFEINRDKRLLPKPFPFRLGDVLPWWNVFDETQ
jgi:hypothetical protein